MRAEGAPPTIHAPVANPTPVATNLNVGRHPGTDGHLSPPASPPGAARSVLGGEKGWRSADEERRSTLGSPILISSVRPVVSGLGLSERSASSSSAGLGSGHAAMVPAAAEAPRPRVQDRLSWQRPKPSRKTLWRRRKSAQRQWEAAAAGRLVSPLMAGKCFRCLRAGHPKRECTNDQVCIRCTEEGHGSGACKRPRSPDSEEELRRKAIEAVARRNTGCAGGSQPGARGQGAPAARQLGAPDRRAPAAPPPRQPAGPPSLPPPLEESAGYWEAESSLLP
jgi:hypothetical protein